MPSAFDVLASDHEQVKRLLSQFEAAPAASGVNDSLLAARKKMAETLVIEESKHEAVEEMYFWPAVRKLLPDGDKLADQAISQEQEGKEASSSRSPGTTSRSRKRGCGLPFGPP
jgi:hypothetical protein